MRRHPKASTRGPRGDLAARRYLHLAGAPMRGLLLSACLLLALAFCVQPAFAGTASGRQFLFSFNGSAAGIGPFGRVTSIATDDSTGAVYVTSQFNGRPALAKFHPDGTAWNFSATGAPTLFGPESKPFENDISIAVDNSGGANQGEILALKRFPEPTLYAYDSAGNLLWINPLNVGNPGKVAVDDSGHPWVLGESEILEYDNTGSPPKLLKGESRSSFAFGMDFDESGNGYLVTFAGLERYAGGDFSTPPTIISASVEAVRVDRSSPSGHIFTLASPPAIDELDSSGTLLASFGQGYYEPGGSTLAYDSGPDQVYVGQQGETFERGGVVAVFGPSLPGGTVPDATIEAAGGVALAHATLHGNVNPQGVPNSYHFEWKTGDEPSWAAAESSPSFSLPEDSSEHAVEYQAPGLSGNRTYQFRLVTENTETGLAGFSTDETFTTPAAAASPVVSIDAVTATATTAHITGTIDPQEDTTTWRLQTSTDPECLTGFTNGATHTIPSEALGDVGIEEDLSGLLPSEHYCVQIEAENSAGSTVSTVSEFTTELVRPAIVTAFAAPRTETTARINARVDPEGAPLVFRFEYSDNGGSSWIVRPSHEDSSESRVQVVVSDELTGLAPGKSYLYRVTAENVVGEANPQGEIEEFTTRALGEMTLPGRGIELINSPEKGNQNVAPGIIAGNGRGILFENGAKSFASDGNRAFWTAAGGIPGGTTGIGNPFVATRTATGWQSENLLPPGEELEGHGDTPFHPIAATPDLSKFLLASGAFIQEPSFQELMRIDLDHHQERVTYQPDPVGEGVLEVGGRTDATPDLQHVVRIDEKTHQLADVGSGRSEVVSLMPDGNPATCGIPGEGGFANGGFFERARPNKRWISVDASRVFFRTETGACNGHLGLFVRNRETEETTEIAPGVGANVQFVNASSDGRTAIFLSNDALVGEDTNTEFDVYRWREGQGLTCLTCVVADAQLRASTDGNAYPALASGDLSHVYFESDRQLVPGLGTAGQTNLYVLAGGAIRFVAETRTKEGQLLEEGPEGDEGGHVPPRLSRDGNVLVFSSTHELTSDRLGKECVVSGSVGPCQAIYRYDDRDGSMECISCRPGGVTEANAGAGVLPDRIADMSVDGETIAFTTRAALLPADVNGGADLYVWSHGALALVTDGVTKFPAGGGQPSLVGVDETGANIFFTVAGGKLTGFEDDGLSNYYDARIGGGFEPPEPAAHCQEESCQGALQPAPGANPALSAGFRGFGNVKDSPPSRRCQKKKGQAKRRCLRAHRKHKHGKRKVKHGRRAHRKHAHGKSGTGK